MEKRVCQKFLTLAEVGVEVPRVGEGLRLGSPVLIEPWLEFEVVRDAKPAAGIWSPALAPTAS